MGCQVCGFGHVAGSGALIVDREACLVAACAALACAERGLRLIGGACERFDRARAGLHVGQLGVLCSEAGVPPSMRCAPCKAEDTLAAIEALRG